MLGSGPLERNVFQLYTRYCESSKSLEGYCGMGRVPQCHLLTPFQEGTYNKLLAQEKNLNSASKVANRIIVVILK